jgi:hypothetical protein
MALSLILMGTVFSVSYRKSTQAPDFWWPQRMRCGFTAEEILNVTRYFELSRDAEVAAQPDAAPSPSVAALPIARRLRRELLRPIGFLA